MMQKHYLMYESYITFLFLPFLEFPFIKKKQKTTNFDFFHLTMLTGAKLADTGWDYGPRASQIEHAMVLYLQK